MRSWAIAALLVAAATSVGAQNGAGKYTPLSGFKVVDTDQGDLNFKLFTYVRYLNQLGADDAYTDAFGNTSRIDLRQDVQFQKVLAYFMGWFMRKDFRYMVYVWTTNTNLGLGAQVVVAGNLTYRFNDRVTVGAGVNGLPGVRATEGQFPNWLTADNRLIADEFFRPSYTTGVWAKGEIAKGLLYQTMLGNNLSQLGVDAGQLDKGINTWSTAVAWMPTTREFGVASRFGDYDFHRKLATRLGAHYTRSNENFQGQPNTDAFENVQIRLSDGNSIFKPDLFGAGVRITDARYQMTSADGGLKYRGLSLEGEYYWRWVNRFRGSSTDTLRGLWDHGFQLQSSAMVVPKQLQVYASGSKVFGQYGRPWDARAGINWFPFSHQAVRWNTEYLHLQRSPVGGLSLPYVVGGRGPVFHTSLEVNF